MVKVEGTTIRPKLKVGSYASRMEKKRFARYCIFFMKTFKEIHWNDDKKNPRRTHTTIQEANLHKLNLFESHPPRWSALSSIRCPCLETRWSTAGPWSRKRCPSSVTTGRRCAPRAPSRPGSATPPAKEVRTSACTEPGNPGWTGTGGPPGEAIKPRLWLGRKHVEATKWCFSAACFTRLHACHFRSCYLFNGAFITSHATLCSIKATLTLAHTNSSTLKDAKCLPYVQ